MIQAFIITTVLALVFQTLPVTAAPQEIVGCKVSKIWSFDGSSEGWKSGHNVSEFTLKDGILSYENTGFDPWIENSDLGALDTSECGFLGIKMRSSASGMNQFYFATDNSPNLGEDKIVTIPIVKSDRFHFYEANLSQLKTWDGKITMLRADLVNGGEEIGAKIDIDWIALYQKPAKITIGRPYSHLTGYDRKGVFTSFLVTNVGGEPSEPGLVITVNKVQQRIGALQPRETKAFEFRYRGFAQTVEVTGKIRDKTYFEAELSLPLEQAGSRRIFNEYTNLEFPSKGAASSAILSCGSSNIKRLPMGVFRPLAALAYNDSKGVMHYLEVGADSVEIDDQEIHPGRAVLQSKRKIEGGMASFTWKFDLLWGESDGRMTCEMTTTAPIDILRFEGPRLLAGEDGFGSSKTHGLFPGLEYLEKNEPSSASRHIGPAYADRHVPHPYKIAVPVMAVEAENGIVGISWDPLAEWAPGRNLPCAEFESPNRSPGAQNHLMTLFAPSVPEFVNEKGEFADYPYRLEPGEKLTLSASFFARLNEKITDVIPKIYEAHGLPKSPAIAHGVDGTIDLCMKAYTESLYFPDKQGWKPIIGFHDPGSFRGDFAATIFGESLRREDPHLAAKCKLTSDTQLTQYTGNTLDWFTESARASVDSVIARQSQDGGFPYALTKDMEERIKTFTEPLGMRATLGDVGATNSGLIVRELNGILSYALQTGRQKYIDAGLKGLAKLNTFTVPRGAQTWEVHAHAPDIYAAALAVDANVAGYQLTGDEKYLEHAKFWACTGLPFVYGWVPPLDPVPAGVFHMDEDGEGRNPTINKPSVFFENQERHINPGATTPVFGTSFYVVNWLGTPVQWCGLSWANSVRRYTRLKPDQTLEAVADLVFASATQQQFEKGFLAGTYPDSWNLIGNVANLVFLEPGGILDYAYALKGEKRPPVTESIGFDLNGRRLLLNSYARIENCQDTLYGIEADLKFYGGQDVYTCITRVAKPADVIVNDQPLAETSDLRTALSGYYYDSANRALHIKYRVPERTAKLAVNW